MLYVSIVTPDTRAAQQGVTPKKGHYEDQKQEGQVKPSNVIHLTYLDFDESHNIAHIYIARQLSYDEAHRKVLHRL